MAYQRGQSKDAKTGHSEDGDRNERMRRSLYLESTRDWMMGMWYLVLVLLERAQDMEDRAGRGVTTMFVTTPPTLAGLIWKTLRCLPLRPHAFQQGKMLDETKTMGGAEKKNWALT
ncbi:hypothetical protein CORC01_08803 [Colletotrichum orchidophilum]|uniref:Uncharacterized protein n=1 Tax=Colletotrichum orchidophilum TaxID=1209926 RepID=A0A1G4B3G9_9PEZI|nr:uncharacterized protein CORC01_08803 [Colletotrichum orchidophilum]OHE95951.1 hypothetical protein CORC01_08803 [Colletotrichum orchidophilum]